MIILTKRINEELDKAGLPELTVLRDDNGQLNLVGRECAKPIMRLSSMPIGKKLSAVERNILIDDYVLVLITKHLKDLKRLMTFMKDSSHKDALVKYQDDLIKDKGIEVFVHNSYTGKPTEYSVSAGGTAVKLNSKGKYETSTNSTSGGVAKAKTNLGITLTAAHELLDEVSKFKELVGKDYEHRLAIEKLQEEMQLKCNI